MGTRVTQIALQEATLKSSIESNKLAALGRLRSGVPNDQKEMEASLAEKRRTGKGQARAREADAEE